MSTHSFSSSTSMSRRFSALPMLQRYRRSSGGRSGGWRPSAALAARRDSQVRFMHPCRAPPWPLILFRHVRRSDKPLCQPKHWPPIDFVGSGECQVTRARRQHSTSIEAMWLWSCAIECRLVPHGRSTTCHDAHSLQNRSMATWLTYVACDDWSLGPELAVWGI